MSGLNDQRRQAAVFLDRDETLIGDRGRLRCAADVVFFPDTMTSLWLLQQDYPLFIVSNQSGLAEDLLTAEVVERLNRSVVEQSANAGVAITQVRWCPHKCSDDCICIKPNRCLLRRAADQHDIDMLTTVKGAV